MTEDQRVRREPAGRGYRADGATSFLAGFWSRRDGTLRRNDGLAEPLCKRCLSCRVHTDRRDHRRGIDARANRPGPFLGKQRHRIERAE